MFALHCALALASAPTLARAHEGPVEVEVDATPSTSIPVDPVAAGATGGAEPADDADARSPDVTAAAAVEPPRSSPARDDASPDADAPRPADDSDAPTPAQRIAEILQPTFLGELDYRAYPSEAEGSTGFAVGRFRMGLRYTPRRWITAVGTIEYADESPRLLDANVTLTPRPWLEFGLGYAKAPLFPSFRYEPVQTLPFANWAPVVTAFRVFRDLGAEVHLVPRRAPIEAIARVGNGSGSILGNDNPLPAGYGSLDLVLGRPRPGHVGDLLGFRLGLGGMIESVRDRNGIAGQTPMGFVYYRPAVVSGRREVAEAHAIGYVGPLRLTFESALAREGRTVDDDGDPDTPRVPVDPITSAGLTGELAWVALGGPRSVGRAPALREGARWRGGALEFAGRVDAMAFGRGARDVAEGGALGGALSAKWWPVDFLAVNIVGYVTRYDVAPIDEPDRILSWGLLTRFSVFLGASLASRGRRTGRAVKGPTRH
ncbi:MAG: hypothetical protein R3B09_26820 [Nannocystaceae bacterium]